MFNGQSLVVKINLVKKIFLVNKMMTFNKPSIKSRLAISEVVYVENICRLAFVVEILIMT